MPSKIFVNLPVSDLDRSMTFFRALGYDFDLRFTDNTAACLVISEDIYAMLLTHDKFRQFTPRAIADTSKTAEVLIAVSMDSREEVDRVMNAAMGAGGSEARDSEDLGFMYLRSFNDLDGHTWEIFYMDMAALAQMSQTSPPPAA